MIATRGENITGVRATVLALLLLAGLTARAAEYEVIEVLPIESVLPASFLRSTYYRLEPTARASDNFHHFRIHTDYGSYAVTSQAMLRIRLHEIATMAELRARFDEHGVAFDRTPDGRYGVGSEHVVDILTDPIGTAAQLVGNIQYNVEQTLAGGSDSSGDKAPAQPAVAAVDHDPGPHKRSAAAELGVDVYSSNPQLQAMLQMLAGERSAGQRLGSISPLLRDVYAEKPFGNGVLGTELDSHLKNTGSEDLNAELATRLVRLGVAAPARIGFLTHPAFTPRTRLYFIAYLELLGDVDGVEKLVDAAAAARTEADAVAYVNYARMLAYYEISRGGLATVVTDARFPTLATAAGDAVLALPLDYLAWTAAVAAAADALHDIRAGHGLERFVILLAGAATPLAQDELERRHIEIRPGYSF